MRILVLVTGEYGRRHVENMQAHLPEGWEIAVWQTPQHLPLVLDYPEDYLPESFAPADLILSLAELPGVAEMIPEIARMSGARAVIAPVDSQAWLPYGLSRQLEGWLAQIGVACVCPMPFCSLTGTHINALRLRREYDIPLVREFARFFGAPAFDVRVDKRGGTITGVSVRQDACCGCARFAAAKLPGAPVNEALETVGLLHHHYPCQASMGIDPLYGDTLMHVSGNIMKEALKEALGDNLVVQYVRPQGRVDG
jgi:hypothetical protein